MADGPPDTPPLSPRRQLLWTEIFRSFQVALDPRKLALAAAGILLMALGWYALSALFDYRKPDRADDAEYGTRAVRAGLGDKKPDGTDYTEADYAREADAKYRRDVAQWAVRHDLAGPNGRLRTMPWYEYRGPNPFLLLTQAIGGQAGDIEGAVRTFFSGTVPVLVEPLGKLLLPVVKLLDPNATFWTRVYLLLCLLWSVAVWAFFGGVITRIAAVQFAGRDRVTLPGAARYVAARYLSYFLSPLVPVGVIAVIVVAMALYGLVALIPILGDIVLYGLGFPLVIVGGIAMAILLVGLVGYPLMYTTVSAEGSDTFDALSRAYNYVFQAPWSYLWYGLVAVLYGAAVVFFVAFVGSLMVYMGKWAVSQAPFSEATGRRPDYLFVYAPESFGWKKLLLDGSPLAKVEQAKADEDTGRVRYEYPDADPAKAADYRKSYAWYEWAGAGMVTFWLVAAFLLVIGFSYSYFWSAATMVYLLMRRKVDETELDEVYAEEEEPEGPLAPPADGAGVGSPATTPSAAASLPVVPPPPPSAAPPAPAAPAAATTASVAGPADAQVTTEAVKTTVERIDLKPGEQVVIPASGDAPAVKTDAPAGGPADKAGDPAP